VLHTTYGVGVSVDMVAHDAAYACLTHLRGEYRETDDSPFRHISIASSEGEEGYCTSIYTPLSCESCATWILVQHADGLDHANRALHYELFATHLCLYDALTHLLTLVVSR
jgi:hypothetical protein